MARKIDLRELVKPDDERDTVVMPDGKEFFLPDLGVKEMARLLLLQEEAQVGDTFGSLSTANDGLVAVLKSANPEAEIPEYDLTMEQIISLVAVFCGAGDISAEVRAAIASLDTEEPTDESAATAAAQLGTDAGLRDEDDALPLASAKPSPKRSSRSAPSGTGGRSGGKKRGGASSKRSSAKRKTSSSV